MLNKRSTAKRCLISMLLTMCLAVTFIPVKSFAVTNDADNWQVSKSKTASPAETTDPNQLFDVKLSLPSSQMNKKYDIVFVIDDSNSTDNADFRTKAAQLLESVYDQDCDIKVGVVGFKGTAQDIINKTDSNYSGLTEVSDDNKNIILNAVRETPTSGNGTNVHGGLSLAEKWLKADSEVPNENKYLVMLTDCRTYIWDDANGKPTTIYAQYTRGLKVQNSGWPAVSQIFNYDKNANIMNFPQDVQAKSAPYRFTVTASSYSTNLEAFKGLYNSSNSELTGSTKYDTQIDFNNWTWGSLGNPTSSGTVNVLNISNTAESSGAWVAATNDYTKHYEFTPTNNSGLSEIKWLEMNPYEVVDTGDSFLYDYNKLNEDCVLYHVSNLEKGVYKASHLWSDLNADYNCYAVIYKKGAGSGLDTAFGMRDWLMQKDNDGKFINSDYSADAGSSGDVAAMFENMENEIIYLVNSGTITDVIGDVFDLFIPKNGDCPFTLTVDGKALTATADPAEANKWHFSSDGSTADAPYTLSYDPKGKDGECFVLDVKVPIKVAEPVEISYKLKFQDPKSIASGTYPTNKYARLDYTSSDGTEGEEYFEVPKVKYTKSSGQEDPGEDPSGKSDGVDTGDHFSIILCLVLMLVACGGAGLALYSRKRRPRR